MTLAAVSDTGPLIHLAEIDSLGLLSTFDTLLVPETVYEEVDAGGVPEGLADLSYELVEADESRIGAEELDAGERAALTIADERGNRPPNRRPRCPKSSIGRRCRSTRLYWRHCAQLRPRTTQQR